MVVAASRIAALLETHSAGPVDKGKLYTLITEIMQEDPNNAGVAETGSEATEYGSAYVHTTVLDVDTVLPAIAGGADLAVGKLLYTFPAGEIWIDMAWMNLALQQTEDNVTADTPDGGLGTTIASGAVAVLGGTAAFENIITGQTFNDVDGTAEVFGSVPTAGAPLRITSSGGLNHTVYFNVADGWAASGDAGVELTGQVVLHWRFMG